MYGSVSTAFEPPLVVGLMSTGDVAKTKRGAKAPRRASPLREMVANTLRQILEHRYGKLTHRKWAEASGISQGTLGRALNAQTGLTLDSLFEIAQTLDVAPYQLLLEIEDAANIPVVPEATVSQKKLWQTFLSLQQQLTAKSS